MTASTALTEQAQLLDLTGDAIFTRDDADEVTYWNRGAEVMSGWRAAEVLGPKVHKLLGTDFLVPLSTIEATLFRSGRWRGDAIHVTRDGRRIVCESRWALRPEVTGNGFVVLETRTDVTQRRAAELGHACCVVTDVQMPGMSGLELQRALAAGGLVLPIVFLTAFPEDRIGNEAFQAGAYGFLSKPFSAQDLATCLEAACAKQAAARGRP